MQSNNKNRAEITSVLLRNIPVLHRIRWVNVKQMPLSCRYRFMGLINYGLSDISLNALCFARTILLHIKILPVTSSAFRAKRLPNYYSDV